MSNTRYVADYNSILFMQAFEEAVQDGYYADDSVTGYPYLLALNEVTLKQMDKPKQRHDLSQIRSVVIQGHDSVPFILDVQDAILQGFYVDGHSVSIGVPHIVTLHKAVQGALDVTPVRQDTPKAVDAPQSVTEAPVATQTTKQRKQKSKEI